MPPNIDIADQGGRDTKKVKNNCFNLSFPLERKFAIAERLRTISVRPTSGRSMLGSTPSGNVTLIIIKYNIIRNQQNIDVLSAILTKGLAGL